MLQCQLAILLCWSCLGNHIVGTSWVQLPCHTQKTLSGSKCPGHLALEAPCSLFCDAAETWCRGHVVDVSIRARHTMISAFWPVVISIRCPQMTLVKTPSSLLPGGHFILKVSLFPVKIHLLVYPTKDAWIPTLFNYKKKAFCLWLFFSFCCCDKHQDKKKLT